MRKTPGPHRAVSRVRDAVVPLIALALVAGACGSSQSSSTRSAARSKTASAAPPFIYAQSNNWVMPPSYNAFSPSFWAYLDGPGLLPLAVAEPSKFAGSYVPQLATSWESTATTVTAHLRRDARWQDGKPFTSRDVMTTLLLQGVEGDASGIWDQLTGLNAPNAHTVVVDVKKGISPKLVLNNLLGVYPLPDSEYGEFLVPKLEHLLLTYYSTGAVPTSAAGKVVARISSELTKFSPKTFLGDGPFRLVKLTSQAGILKRWPGFWDASKIPVTEWEFTSFANGTNVFPALFTHRVDMSLTFPTDPIEQRLVHTPGLVYLPVPASYQWGVYFNYRTYPLNQLDVRKAIAYLVQRTRLDALAYGYHTENQIAAHPDGLIPSVERQWLTPSQVKTLNPYRYNPEKAARLLKGMGFQKKGKWWYLPNGKQFTLTADAPAGWTQTVTEMQVVASELTAFGIETKASAIEQPGYWTQQNNGQFDLDWGWETYGTSDPLASIEDVLYSHNYVSKSEPGIGFGPVAKLPGVGRVNIAKTISRQASTIGPGPKMRQLAWDWARLMNQQLPVLTLANKYSTFEYTTAHFAKWPPKHSYLWPIIGTDVFAGITLAMEKGYIRPKA